MRKGYGEGVCALQQLIWHARRFQLSVGTRLPTSVNFTVGNGVIARPQQYTQLIDKAVIICINSAKPPNLPFFRLGIVTAKFNLRLSASFKINCKER
jgi:hypothetical protein